MQMIMQGQSAPTWTCFPFYRGVGSQILIAGAPPAADHLSLLATDKPKLPPTLATKSLCPRVGQPHCPHSNPPMSSTLHLCTLHTLVLQQFFLLWVLVASATSIFHVTHHLIFSHIVSLYEDAPPSMEPVIRQIPPKRLAIWQLVVDISHQKSG